MFKLSARRRARTEAAAVITLAATFAVPFVTSSPLVFSILNQILIAIPAAFSVFIMLRMNLLTFAVPAFMAIGGYSVAIAAANGITDAIALAVLSFAIPAAVAAPLGAMVLRLKGVYFVLVTFVLTEITQLTLFEMPWLTGGSNGLVAIPPTTLLGTSLSSNRAVLLLATALSLVAALIAVSLTRRFREHFDAIGENALLAQSLGLIVWRYKALGFVVAAGLSGIAGYSLVNMLLTAHPSSFSPISSVNYIAYAIVGGSGSIIGPIVGSAVLVWAANLFNNHGEYSPGLFGLLITLFVLVGKDGIIGILSRLASAPLASDASSPGRHSKAAAVS
ncbi:MAG: branched-chain amino acid ABC transporter permease [Hyphomonadaceae bacterium]|nr:branched-chain amino acid ABC transporter permease [Hyphomonadaceae bacterium]